MVIFPVTNKRTAILKSSYLFIIFTIIFISAYLHSQINKVLIAYLVISFPILIYLFSYLKKQNIKSLKLDQNILIAIYATKTIEIPITQIHNISSSVFVGFNFKFILIKTYTIQLNTKHLFGTCLIVDYKIDESNDVSVKEDPVQIKILKAVIKSFHNKTTEF